MAQALVNRGVTKGGLGDTQGALADYTAVVTLEGAPKKEVAGALVNRGVAKGRLGDTQGELADYAAVLTLVGASKEEVAQRCSIVASPKRGWGTPKARWPTTRRWWRWKARPRSEWPGRWSVAASQTWH